MFMSGPYTDFFLHISKKISTGNSTGIFHQLWRSNLKIWPFRPLWMVKIRKFQRPGGGAWTHSYTYFYRRPCISIWSRCSDYVYVYRHVYTCVHSPVIGFLRFVIDAKWTVGTIVDLHVWVTLCLYSSVWTVLLFSVVDVFSSLMAFEDGGF